MIRLRKRGKLNSRNIRPFDILARIGPIAYKLQLPSEISNVHPVFHVSDLRKYLSDETLPAPLDEIEVSGKLLFVKQPIKIMDIELKYTKESRIPMVKVRWNPKCGLEIHLGIRRPDEIEVPSLILAYMIQM